MGGDDSTPSVIPKLLEGEVLRWQEVVLGAPGSVFSALWDRRCLLQGRKKICHVPS